MRNKRNSLEDTFSSSASSISDLSDSANNNRKNKFSNQFLSQQSGQKQHNYYLDEPSTTNELPSLGIQKPLKGISKMSDAIMLLGIFLVQCWTIFHLYFFCQ